MSIKRIHVSAPRVISRIRIELVAAPKSVPVRAKPQNRHQLIGSSLQPETVSTVGPNPFVLSRDEADRLRAQIGHYAEYWDDPEMDAYDTRSSRSR